MADGPPLEVVRKVRAHALDRAAAAHRAAIAVMERAIARADELARVEHRARDRLAESLAAERSRLSEGACPSELSQLAAFEIGGEATLLAHAQRTAEARADAASLTEAAERTRVLVADARADLEAIERHQARVREEQEKLADARIDEAAEESHAARRRY